jgi:hypothetical protein
MTCATVINVPVYTGRDNDFAIALESPSGGYMSDLSSITRVTLTVGETTVDSAVDGSEVVWWTDTDTYLNETVGVIKFRLGGVGLTAGTYTDCALVYYTAEADDGWQVDNPIKVVVK